MRKKSFNFPANGGIISCVEPPFDIAYRVHGAQFNTITDTEFLKNDPLEVQKVKGMANNVVEMMRLDSEEKLKGKLVPVCE